MKFDLNSIGPKIKMYREAKKIPQYKFAKTVGINPRHQYKIESSENIPSLPLLLKMCSELNVSITDVICEEDPEFFDEASLTDEEKIDIWKIAIHLHSMKQKISVLERELDEKNLLISELKIHIEVIEKMLEDNKIVNRK